MPVDPSRLNAVGDLVLSDPREFRALADPMRLTLFDQIRREGPVTSAALSEQIGLDLESVGSQLGELESTGLIERERSERGELCWTAAVKGIYFEIPDDPEGQRAARDLSNVMLAKYAALPSVWVSEEEPRLTLEWARAAGLFNARIELTADELRDLQERLEQLLEPFTTRRTEDAPAGTAPVRILAYFLPEATPPA